MALLAQLPLAAGLAAVQSPGAGDPGRDPAGWNAPEVQELVRRARATRQEPVTDTAFHSYRADARGFVYFFLDRADSDERTLVKADQIALEVWWQAPNETRQRIVGLRDEKVLPTNIHYHLDHLTVVQDDFGDWITLGDGDEVSRVLHPTGPGALDIYDYRLADSLTLRYGGAAEEVRVYEVEVRPRVPEMPAFVGSIFLDRDRAAIVRMDFTFTAASYVDPYLDYIRISLNNALWEGRWWLPYRQEVELRRELPVLDFMAGSVIRGRFEIGDYVFNQDVPRTLLAYGPVVAVPEESRRRFPFERDLYADLEEEGLEPAPALEEVRATARRMLRDRALSGLRPLRLHLSSVSDAVRYDRAEGLFVGAGLDLRPWPEPRVRLAGGWAFGRERASASVTVAGEDGPLVPSVSLYWDALRDLGPLPGAAGAVNSLGTALLGEDWLDPWFARGAEVRLRRGRPGMGPLLTVRFEEHRSATNEVGGDTRPVRPVQEGVVGTAALRWPVALPLGGEGAATGRVGRMDTRTFGALRADAAWSRGLPDRPWAFGLDASAGLVSDGAPVQDRWHLGGRGTLGGYDYRSLSGRAFWLVRGVATRRVVGPLVGVRALAQVGGAHLPEELPPGWPPTDTGVRASVGAGLALGWDVLRLDLLRGLGEGGRWELAFSVRPRFHPWL